jgi:uncharacterized protein (DUF111 family)
MQAFPLLVLRKRLPRSVGARLEMRKVSRGGLAATKVDVLTDEQSGGEPAHHEDHRMRTHITHPFRMST